MREILHAELAEHLRVKVEAVAKLDLSNADQFARTVVVALPTRAAKVNEVLPAGVLCVALRLRSVGGSLVKEAKPGPAVIISIVSRSPEIRDGARAMLIAAGVDPLSLCEIDAAGDGWRDRIGPHAFVITDIVVARELPGGCEAKVFRVIADSAIDELKQFCGA
jgi:hypothetical protein